MLRMSLICVNMSFRCVLCHSGVSFRCVSVSFRCVSMSFRCVPCHSGVLRIIQVCQYVIQVCSVCESGVFRVSQVCSVCHSGVFRIIQVCSVLFRCGSGYVGVYCDVTKRQTTNKTGIALGVVIALILVVAVVISALFLYRRRRDRPRKTQ